VIQQLGAADAKLPWDYVRSKFWSASYEARIALGDLTDPDERIMALLMSDNATLREAAMSAVRAAGGSLMSVPPDPARDALERLEAATRDASQAVRDAKDALEAATIARNTASAVVHQFTGRAAPAARLAAMLACDNSTVRETTLLAVGARGVAR